MVVLLAPANSDAKDSGRALCKYSVRDVGFVNIHSFGWQLSLAKPDKLTEQQFVDLDQKLGKILENSNIHHIWIAKDSKPLQVEGFKTDKNNASKTHWTGVLSNTNDESFPFLDREIDNESIPGFIASVESLVESNTRKLILESSSDTLCVFVLIESVDEAQNAKARQMLLQVSEKMKKQMWLLEKPTENPPASVLVSVQDRKNDPWFAKTIGMTDVKQPHFAIIYGQGRRLGELIPLESANVDKLVGRASVCGGDCECDLDRDWLYGHQMVHRWHKEHERLAESTLNFDPHAAYVKSEVATIVRKATRKSDPGQKIDLGPGLVIHDLEPLEKKAAEGSPETHAHDIDQTNKKLEVDHGFDKKTPATKTIEENTDEGSGPNWFPAALVLFLVAGVGVAIFWSMTRGG